MELKPSEILVLILQDIIKIRRNASTSDVAKYENKKYIIEDVINLIIKAHVEMDFNVEDQAIRLLFDSSDCEEDFLILMEASEPLTTHGIVGGEYYKKHYVNSAFSRW